MQVSVGKVVFSVIGAGWLLLIAVGFAYLQSYESTAAKDAPVASDWPKDCKLAPQAGAFNVVMAVHPHCPCSRASIEELARLLARCPRDIRVHVLVWKAASSSRDWERTGLWEQAERLPGATVVADEVGRIAEQFGTRTSGQILLYGKDGRLLFNGGITASRGHEGDNPSLNALFARLHGESYEYCQTPVYGCPLSESFDQ